MSDVKQRFEIPQWRIEELANRTRDIENNKYGLANAVPELLKESSFLKEQIQTLEKTIAILGKSNNWYGDDSNWQETEVGYYDAMPSIDIDMNYFAETDHCAGKTARTADKQAKELLGEKEYEKLITR